MPRGVPKLGYRKTSKREALAKTNPSAIKNETITPVVIIQNETDADIEARLAERFDILQDMTSAAIAGDVRAVIVSGAPGVGKSYGIQKALEVWDPEQKNYTIVKGYVKTTGLYKLLYQFRHKNQVLVFDDSDSCLAEETSLNLLKAVCDTTEQRVVSYLAEMTLVDDESAERIPRSFVFNGTIIFITNLDFSAMADRGHKLAPHLQALMSRSHYLDMTMRTCRERLIRIRQVIRAGMLSELSTEQQKDVIEFIEKNYTNMRELSLRACIKLSNLCKSTKNWQRIAKVTMMK